MTILKKLFSGILCASLLAVSAPAKCGKKLGLALIASGVVTAVVAHNHMTPKIKDAEYKYRSHKEIYDRYIGKGPFLHGMTVEIEGFRKAELKLLKERLDLYKKKERKHPHLKMIYLFII